MTGRADRIARMLALVPLGAACGVAVGVLIMVGLFLSAGELPTGGGMFIGIGGGIWLGAPTGAILAPAIGALLMDRVPLRRLVATTAAASIVGGVAGARIVVAMRYIDGGIIGALPGAILGCLVAAAWLYVRTARRGALA